MHVLSCPVPASRTVYDNANIPVLGDSEQVVSCCCEDESFHAEIGSIDNPQIQQKIVEIMEGGEEAFRRRKDIYESWKR